jgi:4-hydroxy-2-oxoglutarate aldolase
MESLKEKLSGIYPPIMTPFIDQKVAYNKLGENIQKYNGTHLRGYMPLGSNGEFRSLTEEESLRVIEVIYKNKAKDKHLMAGTQRESAKATIEFTKKAADKGIEFASVLSPHYYPKKMTDDALLTFFTQIADQSPVPILLYNSPGFSGGVVISPETVGILSQHPNIVGMKDGTKENMSVYVNAAKGPEFYILAGTISKFYTGLLDGGVGGVLSMANYLPELCCELYSLYLKNDTENGQAMHERLCALNGVTGGKYGIAGVKGAMDFLGYFGGDPRVPLLPLTAEERAELKSNLVQEGFIR